MSNPVAVLPPEVANQFLRTGIVHGILLGMLIGSADAVGDSLLTWIETDFAQSFWNYLIEEAFFPTAHEVWLRSMVTVICIAFCVFIGRDKQRNRTQNYRLAYFDPLTGLANAALFWKQLGEQLAHARRNHLQLALLSIDIDQLKRINDALGRPVGDAVVIGTAQRLLQRLRDEDFLAHSNGGKFLCLVPYNNSPDEIMAVAQAILSAASSPLVLDSGEVISTVSIGVALFPGDSRDDNELLQKADAALCDAKKSGGDSVRFYATTMTWKLAEHMRIKSELRHALERNELTVHYQPIVNAQTGQARSFEALARWPQADGKMIPPAIFVPIAEETGQIIVLGEMVLRRACHDLARWHHAGYDALSVAVNVSNRQLHQKGFPQLVEKIMLGAKLPFSCLEIEITESLFMAHVDEAIKTLNELRELGVRISIDDFGTGYSSMSYLQRLPLNKLKIDKCFIDTVATNSGNVPITETMILLAHNLGLYVVAEGVETIEQCRYLRKLDCDSFQGFYFSRPMPFEQCVPYLSAEIPVQKQRVG